MEQAQIIKTVISTFESCSGQLLSPSKCSMLVNDKLDQSTLEQVRIVLGVERVDFEAKYLGLPTPNSRVRADYSSYLRNVSTRGWLLGRENTCLWPGRRC